MEWVCRDFDPRVEYAVSCRPGWRLSHSLGPFGRRKASSVRMAMNSLPALRSFDRRGRLTLTLQVLLRAEQREQEDEVWGGDPC
jgi:hypothetical protein